MPTLLAYVMLFTGIAVFFIFIHLVIGKFVRPNRPDDEKKTIYECGEPTIGSSWVQFDLRFYVVALLFVIFDVEMAFFFPWAVVFGSANELAKNDLTTEQRQTVIASASPHLMVDRTKMESGIGTLEARLIVLRAQQETASDPAERNRKMSEIVESENLKRGMQAQINRIDRLATDGESAAKTSSTFASIVFVDLLIFFGVLLVGFAYLWRRGDLDWVRSVASQKLAG